MINQKPDKLKVGCFVSAHGFGHATRVSAVIQEISKQFNALDLFILGNTPKWFWKINLPQNCTFELFDDITDVGLVQNGPFKHDLNLTLERVTDFIKFKKSQLEFSLSVVTAHQPDFLLCDISPLGIEVGRRLEIPTILLENFTWDWIYQPFIKEDKRFEAVAQKLENIYRNATKRLQCTPFCQGIPGGIKLSPVFRKSTWDKKKVFTRLGIRETQKYILVTTGGISMKHIFRKTPEEFFLVIPGIYKNIRKKNNTIFLPMNIDIPFPALVSAASCVIGKAGYGTVSECWGMNIPFIGVFRDSFRESLVLRSFCQKNLVFNEISLSELCDGSWSELVPALISEKVKQTERKNGATRASSAIIKFLFSKGEVL